MSSPRAYGGGFAVSPFSDTPIYDRLVAERGTPQIGPISLQPQQSSYASALPALPAGPSSGHTPQAAPYRPVPAALPAPVPPMQHVQPATPIPPQRAAYGGGQATGPGGPSYGAPSYGNPSYGGPSHGGPSYGGTPPGGPSYGQSPYGGNHGPTYGGGTGNGYESGNAFGY